jgi:hypothetical protein
MDISNNIDLITLECLTSPHFYDKYNIKKNKPKQISKVDRRFYKKRIINETRKMLRNDFDNIALKGIFTEYIISLIDYFKIVDKRDILQQHYVSDLVDTSNTTYYDDLLDDILGDCSGNSTNNTMNPNELLFKTLNETKKVTLDHFVLKTTPFKEPIVYPEHKEINLNDISLKTKGIRPKREKTYVKKENIDKL